jgi:hypothetical protein
MGDTDELNILLSTKILSTAVVGILVEEFTTCGTIYLTAEFACLPHFQ